ncbi:MAG: putative quorum-sensing-regulated virulence factor [Chlamydiia bacterium]
MKPLHEERFICIDIESTGLDLDKDRICEIGAIQFSLEEEFDSFETLVDPEIVIPQEVIEIHHITNEMCVGKPKIQEVLPKVLPLIENHTIVGHGISFDIGMLQSALKRLGLPDTIGKNRVIDTLRLARLYGEAPSNSLEVLRRHFNVDEEGAHRAMNDVRVNIQVFKKLIRKFRSTKEIIDRLKAPILLKNMPLGKYKGRSFNEIPMNYLIWASKQNYDQDLTHSIKEAIKKCKNKGGFLRANSPFSSLDL